MITDLSINLDELDALVSLAKEGLNARRTYHRYGGVNPRRNPSEDSALHILEKLQKDVEKPSLKDERNNILVYLTPYFIEE